MPPLVVVETPEVIKEETAPEITPVPLQEETPVIVTEEKEKETPVEEKNPELVEYKSTNYGYHFSMSDQMYYAGFGAKN